MEQTTKATFVFQQLRVFFHRHILAVFLYYDLGPIHKYVFSLLHEVCVAYIATEAHH